MRLRVFLLSLLLAAAAAPSYADDGIVVYNAQHEALTQAWADGFTKATGVKVTLRNGEDMDLANQIIQEGDKSPADVFLTENSPAMALVDGAGQFETLPKDILDEVPANFRPSSGNWTGIAARSTVFAYGPCRPELEKPLGSVALGRRLPGDYLGDASAQGRGRDAGMAKGGEGKLDGLSRQHGGDEGR